MKLTEIKKALREMSTDLMPPLNVSILRNATIEAIEPYHRYLAARMGFNAHVKFGNYDAVWQEAVSGAPDLLSDAVNSVVVATYFENLSPSLARDFAGLSAEAVEAEVERIETFSRDVLQGIRRQTSAMVLWHGWELPGYPSLGVLDNQMPGGQWATIVRLNLFLRELLASTVNAYFIDTPSCLMRLGRDRYFDFRHWHMARAPYTGEALAEFAGEHYKHIRAAWGKNKKCLVLDCDNTLWGGIVGEDSISGIFIGQGYPGSAFLDFQREVLALHQRGVIIALCSKNNEADVLEVLRTHPDMLIRESHLSTWQVNWDDKATNLARIGEDLNIGLDSIVFMDDSAFEINLVKQMLPQVEAVHLPLGQASEYAHILASCGYFDTLTISDEDRRRGTMYREEADRKRLHRSAPDINSYLQSLEMVLSVQRVDRIILPRVAQLTQRTNQFNLTTHRYTEEDIERFLSLGNEVLCLRVVDRFGDAGIVGACILKISGDTVSIDTFLLSCRVLGRKIETAFLTKALEVARSRGCVRAIGKYIATAKNAQVATFYTDHGFVQQTKEATESCNFELDISTGVPNIPEVFKKIDLHLQSNAQSTME
jgi:FkbH-like protein